MQKAAATLPRLIDVEPALDVPAARRDRIDDRHAEILLQERDDVEQTPVAAQDVDSVRTACVMPWPAGRLR